MTPKKQGAYIDNGECCMRNLFCFILLIISSIFGSDPIVAEQLTGKVVEIADGDTYWVDSTDKGRVKIRCNGIDAPEMRQPYGEDARNALSKAILHKNVTVKYSEKDKYGRYLGDTYVIFKNELMHVERAGGCGRLVTQSLLGSTETRHENRPVTGTLPPIRTPDTGLTVTVLSTIRRAIFSETQREVFTRQRRQEKTAEFAAEETEDNIISSTSLAGRIRFSCAVCSGNRRFRRCSGSRTGSRIAVLG